MDDVIAQHAIDRGHWPGQTLEQVEAKVAEVRDGAQDSYDFGNGRRIFRKGDTILIEDGKGGGTIFRPDGSALSRRTRWNSTACRVAARSSVRMGPHWTTLAGR